MKIVFAVKTILFVWFIGLITTNCQAQGIASAIQLQDGTIVDCSHIFVEGEAPMFHVQDMKGEDVSWTLSFYNESGGKTVCLESDEGTDQFTFKIEPSLFSGLCLDFQRIEYPNDSSVYIICSVELHHNDIIIDRVPLTLNVLPSRPKVKKASIYGDFDFEYGGYKPYGELAVQFSAERMNDFRLFSVLSDSLNVFQFPDTFWGNFDIVDINEKGTNLYEFSYNYADWGQFYTLFAYNQYGIVAGDTIFTTSLIDDSEILTYIDSVHKQITSIDEVTGGNIRLAVKHNILVIENPANSQLQSEIYSLDGTLVKKNYSSNTIDLSDLSNGIYVAKIISDKNTITQKICIK